MLGRDRDRLDKIVLVAGDTALKPEQRAALEAAPPATFLRAPREALAGWLAPQAGHALDEHLYVVDPMGMWMMRMPPAAEPQRVMRDLRKLLRASSSWDNAGR
jgi:hypothetical protein